MSQHSYDGGCPCGRTHRPPERRPRKRLGPADHAETVAAIYDAKTKGLAAQGDRQGEWAVNYAGRCENPYRIRRQTEKGALMVDYLMRCRHCGPCRKALMGHWAYRATAEMEASSAKGLRTWFGTLTLRPEAVSATLDAAIEEYMWRSPTGEVEDWWDDSLCDYRFALHREVLVKEMTKYWKRLRKAGHKFKYFYVFERHKSGIPHLHWLLHETAEPILKKQLQSQWPHGFTKIKLVGQYDKRRRRKLSPQFAAFYVCKYLSKHVQSRQIASTGYGK